MKVELLATTGMAPMTVKEAIEELSQYPEDLPIMLGVQCWNSDKWMDVEIDEFYYWEGAKEVRVNY